MKCVSFIHRVLGTQRVGTSFILNVLPSFAERETKISEVMYPGSNNKICRIDSHVLEDVCDTCVEVYEQVYKKWVHVHAPSARTNACVQRTALFGKTWVDVYVRRCPFNPNFYISQGNGEAWVFVFIPIEGSSYLKFEVHLGEFEQLLKQKRLASYRYK